MQQNHIDNSNLSDISNVAEVIENKTTDMAFISEPVPPRKKPSKVKSALLSVIFPSVYLGTQFVVSIIAGIILAISIIVNMSSMENISDAISLIGGMLPAISIAYSALTILIAVITIVIQRKNVLHEMGLFYPGTLNLILALMLGVALNCTTSFLLEVIPLPQSWIENYNANSASALFTGTPVMLFLSMAIFIPIAEEVAFRMMPMRALRRAFPSWVAAIATGVVFALAHMLPLQILYVLPTGLILGFLFVWHGGWATVAAHIGYNGFSVILMILAERFTGEDGISTGISPAVLSTVFCVGLVLLMVILYIRRNQKHGAAALYESNGVSEPIDNSDISTR